MGEVRSTACLERCARCSAKLDNSRSEAQSESGPADRVKSGASASRGGFAQRQRSRRRAQKRRQTRRARVRALGKRIGNTDTGGELMLGILLP